jgi:hypothetical protein
MLSLRFALLLSAVSLWTGAAWAQPLPASIVPRIVNLPVVNLASSETAQVNVVNLAASFTAVTGAALPTGGATASCTGTITFYTAAGTSLGSGTPFTIGTGQISSASLPYSQLVSPNGGRTPIRAVVTLTETAGSGVPCTLASNIEIYDTSSGVTNVHVEGGLAAFSGFIAVPNNMYGTIH